MTVAVLAREIDGPDGSSSAFPRIECFTNKFSRLMMVEEGVLIPSSTVLTDG